MQEQHVGTRPFNEQPGCVQSSQKAHPLCCVDAACHEGIAPSRVQERVPPDSRERLLIATSTARPSAVSAQRLASGTSQVHCTCATGGNSSLFALLVADPSFLLSSFPSFPFSSRPAALLFPLSFPPSPAFSLPHSPTRPSTPRGATAS